MFEEAGVPVHDADATVHRLYSEDLAPLIEDAFPGSTDDNGVNRAKLGPMVLDNPAAMAELEAIVHPAVRAQEERFLEIA